MVSTDGTDRRKGEYHFLKLVETIQRKMAIRTVPSTSCQARRGNTVSYQHVFKKVAQRGDLASSIKHRR